MDPNATATTGGFSGILMIVLLFVVMYFMLIRPEKKRKQKAQEMRESLKKGDVITTIGGVVGKIVAVKDDTIVIETSEDRVRVEFTKWAVSSVGVQTSDMPDTSKKKEKKEEAAEVPEEPVNEIPAEEEQQ